MKRVNAKLLNNGFYRKGTDRSDKKMDLCLSSVKLLHCLLFILYCILCL